VPRRRRRCLALLLVLPPLLAGCSQDRSAACATACSSGLACVQNADFPTGGCSNTCSASADCPSGYGCVPMSTGHFCLQTCSDSDQCPLGFACSAAGSAGNACVPVAATPLSGGSCAAPQLVSGGLIGPAAPPSGCQKPIVQSTAPSARVQELGTFDVRAQVTFNVPAGTAAFAIVSQAVSAADVLDYQGEVVANAPTPSPLLAPGGSSFYDFVRENFIVNGNPPPDPTEVLLYQRIFLNPAVTGALVFPNTSPGVALALDGGPPSGTWTLTVDDLARVCPLIDGCDAGTNPAGRYRMTVLTRPGPIPNPGRLDLAVYLVTTTGPSASTAPSNAALQRMASRLTTLFAPAGLCIGTITFYDVPAWAKARYASLDVGTPQDPCGDYRQLLTLVSPGSTAMNLYFLDEIIDPTQNGGTTVGYDGAIPGPPTFPGTVAGGAVVSAADLGSGASSCSGTYAPLDCGSDLVATIVAHETGHFLGLFHTADFMGTSFDALVDTPACVCSACAAPADRAACADQPAPSGPPTEVDRTICLRGTQLCGGADYLMFWQVSGASRGFLSPDEATVMRANPAVASP
jgi:hypothetical protein